MYILIFPFTDFISFYAEAGKVVLQAALQKEINKTGAMTADVVYDYCMAVEDMMVLRIMFDRALELKAGRFLPL